MTRNQRLGWIAALVLALGITVTSGLLHGRMSQRWGVDERMKLAADQLQKFPEQLGPWTQEATYELGKSAQQLLECQGYIQRGYRNRETGDFVKLSVMVGPGSKMSIHVPEICYEASNFSLLGERERFLLPVAGRDHEFWSVSFQVNDVSERRMRVLYGWSTGEEWKAPRMPRWSVAGSPVLYKLQLSYVVNDVSANDSGVSDALLAGFLQPSVSVLQQLIGESPEAPNGGPAQQDVTSAAFLMSDYLNICRRLHRRQSPTILWWDRTFPARMD